MLNKTTKTRRDEGKKRGPSSCLRVFVARLMLAVVCGCVGLLSTGCSKGDGSRPSPSPSPPPAVAAFDGQQSFDLLKRQVEFGPRAPGSESHRKNRDFIKAELQKNEALIKEQTFSATFEGNKFELTNIFGVVRGAGESKKKLLLGAHWDTRPIADKDPDPKNRDKPIPGANDGASGVAVLLEVGRVLKQHTPPHTIILAFFDGEDFGEMFYGSRHFAAQMGELKPDEAIIIDMVGDADFQANQEINSLEAAPQLVERVRRAARQLGLERFFLGSPMTVQDDHVPLIRAGIPAILIIDFDYPFWHTLSDTPDKCSPVSLSIVGRTLLQLIFASPN